MTPDIAGVFAIVSGALVLFALEPIPADLIALGVLRRPSPASAARLSY